MDNPSTLFIALMVLLTIIFIAGVRYLTRLISDFLTKKIPIYKRANEAAANLGTKFENFINSRKGSMFLGILFTVTILFLFINSRANLFQNIESVFKLSLILSTILLLGFIGRKIIS